MVGHKAHNSGLVRDLALPGFLTVLALIVLISLGNWQFRRLAWKVDLIEQVELRPTLPASLLPDVETWPDLTIEDLEYRPFNVEGRFDYNNEALVFTSLPDPKGPYGGPGYWVLTPLHLGNGGTVFVNRGFVPHGREAAEYRIVESVDPSVSLVGLLRRSDPGGAFRPNDQPQENRFHARNPIAIADAKGLTGPIAPFTLDAQADLTPPSGLPQSGETRTFFSNSHLDYALTWYGLAVALCGVFGLFAWRRIKGSGSEAAS